MKPKNLRVFVLYDLIKVEENSQKCSRGNLKSQKQTRDWLNKIFNLSIYFNVLFLSSYCTLGMISGALYILPLVLR